jgi:hypothetical protein
VATIGTTVAVYTAWGASSKTVARWIGVTIGVVTIDKRVAVIIHVVGAIVFVAWRCATILRAITLILTLTHVAVCVAAERRCPTVYLAIVAILSSLAGVIPTAIRNRRLVAGIFPFVAPVIITVNRIDAAASPATVPS